MNTSDCGAVAQNNFDNLSRNPYPGRGLILGRNDQGFLVQVYWVMGRSENSRNRVLSYDKTTGRLYTEAADPKKVTDPKLIIYNAMDELRSPRAFIVSNGDQTDALIRGFATGKTFQQTLHEWEYEPDAPNLTSRISGFFLVDNGLGVLSLLRKSRWGTTCDRFFFTAPLSGFHAGFGFGLTTYSGDGNPLPSFEGEPLLLPLRGDVQSIAETYWEALNEANRVSLAVKIIGERQSVIQIINKYEKVAAG